MALKYDWLLAETARVRQNRDLVRFVVERAQSPTEAEQYAKGNEYPTDLVRGTRLLSLMKRDYAVEFNRDLQIPDGELDPWRYFNCVYTQGVDKPEETGMLAVKPISYLPALFWTYALYDAEWEQLFSFENGIVGDRT
ncbi:MAG: hypothetical protein AAB710_00005, partial [Patescibacteria group bacterium]